MRRKSAGPTIADVAKMAYVSKTTVSHVLNATRFVEEETRQRVVQAIATLGYRPNVVARSLATGRTQTIALLVSDSSSPFMGRLTVAAEDCARSAGYRLVLYDTHDDPDREATYFAAAVERRVDGVLFVSATDKEAGLDVLRNADIPFVAVDRIPDPYKGPAVIFDNVKAGHLAAEHLLSLGHRHCGHISAPASVLIARERAEGFRQVLETGGAGRPEFAVAANWDYGAGFEAMQQLLARPALPTAIFTSGDALAIGAMSAIHQAGLSVPQDISVVGVDDIDISAFINPPLTTVRQSIAELATLGLQLLFDILDDRQSAQTTIVMVPALVVRKSTAAPQR